MENNNTNTNAAPDSCKSLVKRLKRGMGAMATTAKKEADKAKSDEKEDKE